MGHHTLSSCDAFSLDVSDVDTYDEEIQEDLPEGYGVSGSITLGSGEALSGSDADLLLRRWPARIVSIVGEKSSGKTTLICALYDRFLRGPFAGYIFAGSNSLVAFEKRIHYSRGASGLAKPETPRTSMADGLQFFHLAVCPESDPTKRFDLLLSDRAGETYTRARSAPVHVRELVEISNAHDVVILLDGARLAEAAHRSGAIHAVRQTVRAFSDGGAFTANSAVQLITTKVDLLSQHPARQAISDQVKTLRLQLQQDFGHKIGKLSFWEIAARDPVFALDPAHGMDKLFRYWLRPPGPLTLPKMGVPLRSQFDKMLTRVPYDVLK